jgi:hypothetical protein
MAFASGFVLSEAKDLLALSAAIEGVHDPIIPNPPAGWSLVLDPPEIGPLQNKWQLWKRNNDSAFAIVVRGTIPQPGSILEDVIALMIEAKGAIDFGPFKIDYAFAGDPEAGIHLGFTLGALLLLLDPLNGILAQLVSQQQVGAGNSVYVTGHSQGAAVATLIRSYLEYGPSRPANLPYKTYVFAQPKPGNDHYAEDYENAFCKSGMAFTVNNTLDWVPEVPLTLQLLSDIDKPNPLSTVKTFAIDKVLSRIVDTAKSAEPLALAKYDGMFAALAKATGHSTAAIHTPILPLKPTLNYVAAGTVWPLIGALCQGAECQDGFFEHHATTYYQLLSK